MPLQLNIRSSARLKEDQPSRKLIAFLESIAEELKLVDAVVYYDQPLFRDTDDVLYRTKVLFASRSHGLTLFGTSGQSDRTISAQTLLALDDELSQLHSIIYGKLLKSRILRASRQRLAFEPLTFIYLPEINNKREELQKSDIESELLFSLSVLQQTIQESLLERPLSKEAFAELRSILEGAKGMLRPKERRIPEEFTEGKAAILGRLEAEINNFDEEQRRAAMSIIEGPQRIRGLAQYSSLN